MALVLSTASVRLLLNKLAGDGASPAGLSISASTNASPAVATFSTPHGLSVGDVVFIAGTTGETALNGMRKVATTPLGTTATFTDLFTAAAVNGNGVFAGTVTAQRVNSALTPGDLLDLLAALDKVSGKSGPFADVNRAAESSISTILGA